MKKKEKKEGDSLIEKLKESEDKFKYIFNSINDAAVIHSLDGKILEVNDIFVKRLNYSKKEFMNLSLNKIDSPEFAKKVSERVKEVMQKGAYIFESVHITKEGKRIPVEVSAKLIEFNGEKAIISICRDITERKNIEGELKEKISILNGLTNNLKSAMIYQAIVFKDGSKKFTYFSDTVKKFYGVSPEEAIKNPSLIYRRLYVEDKPALIAAELKAIKTLSPFRFETRINDPSGKIRWSYFISTPRKLEDGSYCFDGVEFDITERKNAEESLKNSEARFRSYFNMSLHGIAITSPEKGWVEVNSKVCSILGYSRDELLSKSWAEMTYPADLAADENQFNKVLTGKIDSYNLNKRFIRKDKKVIWTNLSVGCVRKPDGKVDYIVALLEDITEKKKVEEELKESEERFNLFLDNSPIYVFFKDENIRPIKLSKNYEKMLHRPLKKILGKSMFELFPSKMAKKMVEDDKKVLHEGKKITILEELDGRTYETIKFPILQDGKPSFLAGYTIDITEQKKAEEELKKAKENLDKMVVERTAELERQKVFFSSILENVPDMIFVKDARDLKFELFNKAGENLLGYNRKDLLGKSDYDFFPKDQAEFFIKKDRAVLKNGKLLDIPEEPINTKSGKKFLHTKKIPLVTKDGDRYLLGISEDITQEKRTQIEYKSILDTMSDGFCILDLKGNIIDINDSYCKMIGYSREDLLQMRIDSVEALQSKKDIEDHIKEIVLLGSGKFETAQRCKNGNTIDVEVSVNYIESGNKLFAFVHNITQRKKNEREIIARSQELEKFNKIAIGRELKMVELKKKIARFEGKKYED